MDNSKLVKQYWTYMDGGEFHKAGTCMAGDAIVYFPNTREAFRGRDAFIAFNTHYPGKWSIGIEKMITAGDTIVTAVRVMPEDGATSFCATSFFIIHNGLIQEITEYWGENGEPPQWRQDTPYAERY